MQNCQAASALTEKHFVTKMPTVGTLVFGNPLQGVAMDTERPKQMCTCWLDWLLEDWPSPRRGLE